MMGKGAYPSVNQKDVSQIQIPLPSLSIQEDFVAELDSYQKIIDGARQVVENYKPSIPISSSWEVIPLRNLCENLDSKRIPITSSDRETGDVPYYGASGIVDYVKDYIFDEPLLAMGQDMIQQLHVPLPGFMQEELKPLPWEVERNSLIKKECHKYDEEWRMLANCKMNLPAMIECVPAGVIIGLRTPPVDKNLIISMAKEAGVKNIYQSYIDEKNRLNAYLLKDV